MGDDPMDHHPGQTVGVCIPSPSPGIYAHACACGSLNDQGAFACFSCFRFICAYALKLELNARVL